MYIWIVTVSFKIWLEWLSFISISIGNLILYTTKWNQNKKMVSLWYYFWCHAIYKNAALINDTNDIASIWFHFFEILTPYFYILLLFIVFIDLCILPVLFVTIYNYIQPFMQSFKSSSFLLFNSFTSWLTQCRLLFGSSIIIIHGGLWYCFWC